MRITLGGDLGSGKSSVGRRLSEVLKIPYYSAGQLFREIGQISNLDALATNLEAETNVDIDAAVDQRTKDLDRDLPDFILDSRMGWHFVTNAVKVYLSASPETAAHRIVGDVSRSSENYADAESAMMMLRRRRESERKRYKKLYGVDIEDRENYDIWIITDDATLDDICAIILAFVAKNTHHREWIPKSRIVPMIGLREASSVTPRRAGLADHEFDVPLLVAQNYGLFFDDAETLAQALKYEMPLVPYRSKTPGGLPSKGSPFDFAKQTLTHSGLQDWEDAFSVEFSFHKYLEGEPAPAAALGRH